MGKKNKPSDYELLFERFTEDVDLSKVYDQESFYDVMNEWLNPAIKDRDSAIEKLWDRFQEYVDYLDLPPEELPIELYLEKTFPEKESWELEPFHVAVERAIRFEDDRRRWASFMGTIRKYVDAGWFTWDEVREVWSWLKLKKI